MEGKGLRKVVGIGCQEDDVGLWMDAENLFCQRNAIHSWHSDIQKDHRNIVDLQIFKCFTGTGEA